MNPLLRKIVGSILCVALGLGLGFFWGKRSAPEKEATAGSEISKPTRVATRPAPPPETGLEAQPENQTNAVSAVADLDTILGIKLAQQRHSALADFARNLASKDLSAAIQSFHMLRNVHDKAAYLDGLIDVYARAKPMESLEFLRSLPPGFVRNVNLERALAIIAETSPQLAAEQIKVLLTGVDAHNALIRVSDVWSQTNPAEAFGWAMLNLKGASRQAALEQMASTWAQTNPAEALNHVLNAPGLSSADRELALRAIAGTWAMSEPEAAIAWAERYWRTGGSSEPFQIALMNLAVSDPASAAARAAQITDQNLAAQAYPAIASTWGSIAPVDAAAWVNTLPAGNGKSGAVVQLAESWANVDPAAALRWALQLPGLEPARDDAIRQAAMTWDRFNSGQMDQFLKGLSPAQAAEINRLLTSELQPEPPQRERFGRD